MATSTPPAIRAAMLDRIYIALLRQPADDAPPEPPDDPQKDAASLYPAASESEEEAA